jgi:hypothetical protein
MRNPLFPPESQKPVIDCPYCNASRSKIPSPTATRVPVDFRYDALNPAFLKMLARIAAYADTKYGSWSQYTKSRLTGEKGPVNHMQEHLRAYVMGEGYDRFDGDPRWHLAAIAYNAMMAYWYHSKWGPEVHPLTIREDNESNTGR